MKPNLATFSKIYIICFALANYSDLLSVLGIGGSLITAPGYLSFWWWHVIFFLTYMVLPVVTILINNYRCYVVLAGVSLAGILIDILGVFTWTTNLHTLLLPFYALAAIVSLNLAVENVASKISAEILSLESSRF